MDDSGAEYPVVVDPFVQTAKLTAKDGAANDYFGNSVSVSGDTVVVGARNANIGLKSEQGAAYVFVKPVTGWANMTQTAKLTASDGAENDYFGFSVSVSGDTVVAGALYAKIGSNTDQGAASVFQAQPPQPPKSIAASPDTICAGGSSILSAEVGAGEEVLWFTGSCGGTPSTSSVSPTVNTTYYARARNTATGCVSPICAEATVTVNIPAAPTSPSATPSAICAGGSSTLSATVGTGEEVLWFTGSCGGTPSPSSVSPTVNTTYYARARNTTTGCVSPTCGDANVTVNPIPAGCAITAPSSVTPGSRGNTASTVETIGADHHWSIYVDGETTSRDGLITSGQGTYQITWTAPVPFTKLNIGVVVTTPATCRCINDPVVSGNPGEGKEVTSSPGIPTFSQWGLVLFTLALGGVGLIALRRRRVNV